MDSNSILAVMKSYFADKQPPEALERFPDLLPQKLLKESLDVVDFVVFLEEHLGRQIDIRKVSEMFANRCFGELAGDVSQLLAEGR